MPAIAQNPLENVQLDIHDFDSKERVKHFVDILYELLSVKNADSLNTPQAGLKCRLTLNIDVKESWYE